MAPVGCSTGTVSVNVPVPVSRQVSVIGRVGGEEVGELGDAAVETVARLDVAAVLRARRG